MSELIILRTLFKIKDLITNSQNTTNYFYINHPTLGKIKFLVVKSPEHELYYISVFKPFIKRKYYQYLEIALKIDEDKTILELDTKKYDIPTVLDFTDLEFILRFSRDIIDSNIKTIGGQINISNTTFINSEMFEEELSII